MPHFPFLGRRDSAQSSRPERVTGRPSGNSAHLMYSIHPYTYDMMFPYLKKANLPRGRDAKPTGLSEAAGLLKGGFKTYLIIPLLTNQVLLNMLRGAANAAKPVHRNGDALCKTLP